MSRHSDATAGSSLLHSIWNRRMLVCVATGFSSGLPLYVLFQLVPAWMKDEGVSLVEIGLFNLVTFPYTWKFVWAPLLDRWVPLSLGRRRSTMLVFQLLLIVSIGSLGFFDVSNSLVAVAWLAFVVAFFSASQDIVIDAFRREVLPDHELGLGNSVHVQAYRISGLIPGALSLSMAQHFAWSTVFMVTAGFMLVGVALSLLASEPEYEAPRAGGLKAIIVEPFAEYLRRSGLARLLLVLAFLFLYKLGDNMATALAYPMYLDLGYSKGEIAAVAKNAALWPAVFGGLLGGVVMLKLGINRALWAFGVVQLLSILGFAVLAENPPNLWLLAGVIAFENLGVGLGTAAFVAFIARETSKTFAAAQFALFTALAALPRTLANASTGVLVEHLGWTHFFILCTVLAVPGMVLLFWVAPWRPARA